MNLPYTFCCVTGLQTRSLRFTEKKRNFAQSDIWCVSHVSDRSPSLSFAMSMLPLFICRAACSAGRSWCRRAGSCSRAGDGDWTDWGTCPEEEEEEEDMAEGVEPKAPGAEFRLWEEEEEEEEWPELDAADWSPGVVSVERKALVNRTCVRENLCRF